MHYTNKELAEQANEQLRKSEEYRRQILETIAVKKRQCAEDVARKVIAKQGLVVNDEEFQQIVDHVMQIMDKQGEQSMIVVNEINIGEA